MNRQAVLTIQKCVLKVDIHCNSCARKVKKILQRFDGVFYVETELGEKKVTVYGSVVEPAAIIEKLKKKGKHAEIWADMMDECCESATVPECMHTHHNHNHNHHHHHRCGCGGSNYEQYHYPTMFSDENANHFCIIM